LMWLHSWFNNVREQNSFVSWNFIWDMKIKTFIMYWQKHFCLVW
jgi:hypothetical protein